MEVKLSPMSENLVYFLVNEHRIWKEIYDRAPSYGEMAIRLVAQKEFDAMFCEARKKYTVNFTYPYFRKLVEGYLFSLLLYRPANSDEAPLTAVSMETDIYDKGYVNNFRQYIYQQDRYDVLQKKNHPTI